MREIRTLRAKRRELETEPRTLLNGHEGGNPGHGQASVLRATAPTLDPTGVVTLCRWNLGFQNLRRKEIWVRRAAEADTASPKNGELKFPTNLLRLTRLELSNTR